MRAEVPGSKEATNMTLTRIGQEHWIERGRRIERARKWVGVNQTELAEALTELLDRGYSRTAISNLESGERTLAVDELRALAYLLNQSEEWLDCDPDAEFDAAAHRENLRLRVLGIATHIPTLAAA